MQSLRQAVGIAVAAAAIGGPASAQQPVRARSELSIPVKKNITPAEAPAPRVVPGSKTEVIAQPVVVHLIRNEAGTPVMLAERAPTAGGGPAVPWIPLFGLLGGAVLLNNLNHGSSGTPTPPTPPVTQPTPPVTPPVTPPTTVPEPATMVLFATGLVALAAVRRRVR